MQPLLNRNLIRNKLIATDTWAEGHGVIKRCDFLGTSFLYFALCYLLPAKIAVILGSGSGYVPRLVRQAQKEIYDDSFSQNSRCILIDANQNDKGFGTPDYHDNPDHFFHKSYPEIEVWRVTTDAAFKQLKKDKIKIDFLHIDADHTFKQSLQDFENYLSIMSEDFIITLHDTAIGHLENKHDGCVPRTIAYLREQMQINEKYRNLEIINFNNRHQKKSNHFKKEMHCCGTAVIKPKHSSFWDEVYTSSS